MQFPFRNPVTDNAGDGDPPEWTPPSYAKEASSDSSDEEWKPPSYAEPVKAEASKKPSVFSRAIDAIKPEKSARPIDLGVAIPAQYRQFLDEHPSIKSVLKGGVADPDIPLKQKVSELFNGKQTDTQDHKILGPEMTPIPFAKEVGEYIKDKGISSGKYSLGAAGSVINDILNSFPADARGAFPEAKEPSLRQSGRMSAESAAKPLDASIRPPSELSGDLSLPREESQVKQPLKSNLEKVSEPINKADVPREFVLPEDEAAHNEAVKEDKPAGMAEDKLYDLARNKQGMAQDLPAADAEEVKKPNFVNSFEKPKIETVPEELAKGWKPPEYAQSAIEETPKTKGIPDDGLVEMHGGLGGIKPSSRVLEPNSGPYGKALDKLFSAMGDIKEARVTQDTINRTERAKRFSNFANVKDEGVAGATKSLSTLKGEFDKVDYDKLKMTPPQVDSLFTAVKRANITSGEKARGYTALFKLFNGESLPARSELKILDDVFGNNFADKITEMHGGIGAVGLKIGKLANTMKSMQNAISLAAPLRHGIGLVARKEFYPAFTDMFKFFGNREYYNTAMQALEERPNYMLGREGGLFLSKPASLMNSEEEFLNSYVGDIPGVRTAVGASQRSYTGFLNKLRVDTFDSMIKQAKALGHDVGDGENPTEATKAIAKFINNATGRGSLGPLNKMTNELNTLLWSPRMISSRINMLANPKIYMDLPQGMRLEGLKSLLGIAALGTAIDTLASYGGAKVSSNILSTDFGKSRLGTSLIDPWGGFQQYIVGAARFLAGKTDSSQPTNRLEIAGNFMKNKESPAASLAHTLLTAKFTGKSEDPATAGNMTTQYGQKTSMQSQIGKAFTPIFMQDLIDLANKEPNWADSIGLNSALGLASLAGMSQDYPEKKKGSMFRKMKAK